MRPTPPILTVLLRLLLAVLLLPTTGCELFQSTPSAKPEALTLSYEPSPMVLARGYPMTAVTPYVGGYTGSPDALVFEGDSTPYAFFNLGLQVDKATGVLSGTPGLLTTVSAKFAVSGTQASGRRARGKTQVEIRVIDVTPLSPLVYDYTQAVFQVGQPIAEDRATITGGVTAWSVVPDLPPGLFLSSIDGSIGGTPLAPSPETDYTVTASNPLGSQQALLRFEVVSSGLVPRAIWSAGGEHVLVSERDDFSGELFPGRARSFPDVFQAMTVRPDGAFAYVSDTTGNVFRLTVDPRTALPADETLEIAATGLISALESLTCSGDGTRLLGTSYFSLSGFQVLLRSIAIDLATGALGAEETRPLPDDAAQVVCHPTFPLAYVPTGADGTVQVFRITPSLQLADEVTLAGYPVDVEPTPDGRFVYVHLSGGSIQAFRANDLPSIQSGAPALEPAGPAFALAGSVVDVEADNGALFVLYDVPGRVVELTIDAATGELSDEGKAEAALGPFPARLLALAGTSQLYALDPSSRAIWQLDHSAGGPRVVGASRARDSAHALMAVSGPPAPRVESAWVLSTSRADDTLTTARIEADGVLVRSAQGAVATASGPVQALALGGKAYVLCQGGALQWFDFDAATGALAPAGTLALGVDLRAMAVHRSGDFLYVLDGDSGQGNGLGRIHVLALASDGSLAATALTAQADAGAVALGLDPAGEMLFALGNQARAWRIGGQGDLIPAAGPLPFHDVGAIAFHPAGRFAYVSNPALGAVHVYALGNPFLGELVELSQSPFVAGTGTRALAIDGRGVYLCAADVDSRSVTVFEPQAADGTLAQASFSPVPTSGRPVSLALDAGLRFLFAGVDGAQPGVASFHLFSGGTFGTTIDELAVGAEPVGLAAADGTP